MELYQRSDLRYVYSWNANLNKRNSLDCKLEKFDRNDGYEMLRFINYYCKIHGFKDKSMASIIELIIQEAMPKELTTKNEIMKWLDYKLLFFLSKE